MRKDSKLLWELLPLQQHSRVALAPEMLEGPSRPQKNTWAQEWRLSNAHSNPSGIGILRLTKIHASIKTFFNWRVRHLEWPQMGRLGQRKLNIHIFIFCELHFCIGMYWYVWVCTWFRVCGESLVDNDLFRLFGVVVEFCFRPHSYFNETIRQMWMPCHWEHNSSCCLLISCRNNSSILNWFKPKEVFYVSV